MEIATKGQSLNVREYIATHQVFSLDIFKGEFGDGRTPYNLLVRAVSAGKVDRVCRGVYVSHAGRFEGQTPSGYQIALALAPDAVFAYHSALTLNGIAQSPSRAIQFYSTKTVKKLSYEGFTFTSYRHSDTENLETRVVLASGIDERYRVTTPEQTLVDCLNYPMRAGGAEELIRSLSSLQFVNNKRIKALVNRLPKASVVRIGWLLQQNKNEWKLTDEELDYYRVFVGNGTFRFSPTEGAGIKENWDPDWRLYLPAPVEEVRTWV